MKVLYRYLSRQIYGASLLVMSGLLALFSFFDLAHQLGSIGQGHYTLWPVFEVVLLHFPANAYRLMPVTALIGGLYALIQLNHSSEFTVMRVSGMSVPRMSYAMVRTGMGFMLVTLLLGEVVVPYSQQAAQQLKLRATHSMVAQEFRSGLWVKDAGRFVNVSQIKPDMTLLDINIYSFDPQWRLTSIEQAAKGMYIGHNRWNLTDVVQTRFSPERTQIVHLPQMTWKTVLNPDILSVLLVVPDDLSIGDLYSYITHFEANGQRVARYEIALWAKLFYPFTCLIMLLLALSFAYLPARSVASSGRLITAILVGLFFYLTNQIFVHLGVLNNWPPIFSALLPGVLFFLVAFYLLVRVERI
ncbi:MAG: LPS export ABC transporter permease LptG [Pseudomonadota bacterium]|nr:LPS export ABC transporter permease LptG [Pseudomonadota bacterium]